MQPAACQTSITRENVISTHKVDERATPATACGMQPAACQIAHDRSPRSTRAARTPASARSACSALASASKHTGVVLRHVFVLLMQAQPHCLVSGYGDDSLRRYVSVQARPFPHNVRYTWDAIGRGVATARKHGQLRRQTGRTGTHPDAYEAPQTISLPSSRRKAICVVDVNTAS